jgi:spermidine synthase
LRKYEFAVFVTGAVTLSLEVLASRIMTPYFGVSLYIWSGILSITLVFLAIGYRIGGSISSDASLPSVEFRLLAAPTVSALAIVLSAVAYPVVFPLLSQVNLIVGSFIGATLLLALPLIALSAMNPLLITLQRSKSKSSDAGAGRVFFISTMGSVAGVLFTTFLFIPNLTNFRAILILGISVCVITTVLVVLSKNLARKNKRFLLASGMVVSILCGVVLVGKTTYLEWVSSVFNNYSTFKVKAEYTSMFGNIKIAEVTRNNDPDSFEKYFIQDGLIQNRTDVNNKSISMYTYVLESLVHAYAPKAKDVIVLGLGAGVVPQHFQDDGIRVSVVEINSTALIAASDNFGFDERGIQIYLEDARTFIRKCDQAYDVAVVDLFLGDSTPDYLMTKEFFRDLRSCLKPGGTMVMNAILDDENSEPNRRMFATIATSFPRLYFSGVSGGNSFIVGTSGTAPDRILVEATELPYQIAGMVEFAITSSKRIPPDYYDGARPVSDDHNTYGVLFSAANMATRKFLSGHFPPHILVN